MAVDQNLLNELVQVIQKMIESGNASIAQNKLSAATEAMELRKSKETIKTADEFNKVIGKASKDAKANIENLGLQSKLSSVMIGETVSSFKSMDVAAQHLSKQLTEGLKKLEISTESYGKQIKSLEDVLEFKNGIAALEELVEAQMAAANAQDGNTDALNKAKAEIEDSNLPDYFKRLANEAEGNATSIQHNATQLDNLSLMQGNAAQAHKEYTTILKDSGTEIVRNSLKRADSFFTLSNAMDVFKEAITIGVASAFSQIQHGSTMSVLAFEASSTRLALQGPVLAELMANYRQVGFALGGNGGMVEALNDNIDSMRKITGSRAEAAKVTAKSMDILATSGALTSTSMKDVTKNLTHLKVMGVDAATSLGVMSEMSQIGANRTQLLNAATDKERQAIMNGTMVRFKEMKAMGMSTEQATNAAKALGMIKGQDIRQRFKQAAKMRMAMDSQGISGGAEVQKIIMAGRRVKPGSKEGETLRRAMEAVSLKTSEGRTGSFGQEIFAERLLDTMGPLKQMLDPDTSPMINVLNKQKAIADTTGKSIDQQTKMLETKLDELSGALFANTTEAGLLLTGEKLLGMRDTTGGKIVETLVIGFGAVVAAIIARGLIGSAIGGVGKMFSGGKNALKNAGKVKTFPGAQGKPGMFNKMGSAVGNGAAAVKGAMGFGPKGLSLAPVGANLSNAVPAATSGLAKVTGKTLLKTIPGIAAVAALFFASQRAMAGDYVGAGAEIVSGLAATVPGLGTAAAVAIQGGLIASDMSGTSMQDRVMGTPTAKQTTSPSAKLDNVANEKSKEIAKKQTKEIAKKTEVAPISVKQVDTESTKKMTAAMEGMDKKLSEMLTLHRDHYVKIEDISADGNAENQKQRRLFSQSNNRLSTAS